MSKLFNPFIYLILIIAISGCGDKFQTERFYAMGTFVSITLPTNKVKLLPDLRGNITNLENTIKSETEKANETQDFCFKGLMDYLYESGSKFSDLTGDRFSIFAYTIAKEYGFHEGPYRVPSDIRIQQLVKNIDRMYDVSVDMGAFAKGYIVDQTVAQLRKNKVPSAMVNAGGDLYALGNKGDRKWRVAVKLPESDERFLSILELENMALATSGDYERFFIAPDGQKIFHIFDAKTGKNPEYYSSVSVIADTVEQADGLATAFFLLPPDEVAEKCNVLKTPVLLYDHESKITKLCGWEKFETD